MFEQPAESKIERFTQLINSIIFKCVFGVVFFHFEFISSSNDCGFCGKPEFSRVFHRIHGFSRSFYECFTHRFCRRASYGLGAGMGDITKLSPGESGTPASKEEWAGHKRQRLTMLRVLPLSWSPKSFSRPLWSFAETIPLKGPSNINTINTNFFCKN